MANMQIDRALQDGEDEDDSDDERNLDERVEDMKFDTTEHVLEKIKKRIRKLVEERDRKTEYQDRLLKKLRKLESELAKSRQDVEQTQRQLDMLSRKGQEEGRKTQLELNKVALRQDENIREHLSEVLYAKARNAPGKGTFELDTVKVAYKKDPSTMVWYNLQFRCDDKTTVKALRKNVCNYWEIKDQDYILKTMANNKCNEDMQLADCFKNGEIAMLRLERKDQKNADPPGEDELKAIQAKKPAPKQQKKGGGEAYDPRKAALNVHGAQDNHRAELEKMGGTYFLLRTPEDKPSEHDNKIKLLDIVIYTAMLIMTFWVYTSRRPERVEYCFTRSLEEQLLATWRYSTDDFDAGVRLTNEIPSFRHLKTREQLWDWLGGTLPGVIWDTSDTSIGTYNLLLGYLSIRVQGITGSQCDDGNDNFVQQLRTLHQDPSAGCYGLLEYGDNEATGNILAVQQCWQNPGANCPELINVGGQASPELRGPANPGVWQSARHNEENHKIGSTPGRLGTYDASGYSMDYRMIVSNLSLAAPLYTQDLLYLKNQSWISSNTRVVIVSFALYNFHYDLWMSIDLIAELPSSGAIVTSYNIRPFAQRQDESRMELQETYVDWIRMVCALYIFFYVGYAERRHKTRNHKAGFRYHVSLNGITDWGIVICVLTCVFWRWVDFQGNDTTADFLMNTHDDPPSNGFTSYSRKSAAYQSIFVVEGFLMVFLTYRMISFFRLNSHVYTLCHALGRAFREFVYFLLIFFPLIFGIIMYLHRMYGSYIEGFDSVATTTVQVYRLLEGNLMIQDLIDRDPLRALTLMILMYVAFTFLVLNVFATIVVDAYYVTRITTVPGPSWSATRWTQWAMPGLCFQLYTAANQYGAKVDGEGA